jgi:hypothetical protein
MDLQTTSHAVFAPDSSTTLLHTGPINYASSNITARRKSEFHGSFQRAITEAVERNVDGVVATGQLFATQSPAKKNIAAIRESLGELRDAEIPCFLAGSPRDHEYELVEALADDGLLTMLSTTPVVVGDVALYGTPPTEAADPVAVARSLEPMPDGATSATLAVSGTVRPPVEDGDVSVRALQTAAPVTLDAVFAGHRRHRRSHQPTRVDSCDVYQAGPAEYMLRKWVIDQPPEYPCTVRIVGPTGSEAVALPHRPFAMYTLERPDADDLPAIKDTLDCAGQTVLVQLTGPRGPDPLDEQALSEWIDEQTAVAKVWDDRTDETTPQPMTVDVVTAVPPIDDPLAASTDEPESEPSTTELDTSPSAPSVEDSSTETAPQPNELTELYVAFWSMRTVIEGVLDHDGHEIYGDTDHPLAQYRALLNKLCWGTSLVEETIPGYGNLQKEVVPFSHREYRKAYGNDEWVTEFQCIDTVPFAETTQTELDRHDIVDDATVHVRPVAPESGEPLPEAPTTDSELHDALELLSEFPIVPEIPWELTDTDLNGQSRTATYPMGRLYEAYCEDIGRTPTVDIASAKPSETASPSMPEWLSETPAAESSPNTDPEISSFLSRHGKLTHLYREVTPQVDSAVDQPVPVFALDQYEPLSGSNNTSEYSFRLYNFAKQGDRQHFGHFVERLRDLVYQRILTAKTTFDLITVYPGHEAGSVNPELAELAQKTTDETHIIYADLLERTKTVQSQKQQGQDGRWDVAKEPTAHLDATNRLDGRSVLLLDDICTSGASLAAGAHVLRQAGAEEVVGLVLGSTHNYRDESVAVLSDRDTTVMDLGETE